MEHTKAKIREEYLLLLEMQGFIALAQAKAERLRIAVDRDKLSEDLTELWHEVEFEASIQHNACKLGHGRDEA